MNNVNQAVEFLQSNLKNLFDKHAPLIEKRVRGKPCEWLSENIKSQMNRRDMLLRRARRLKNDQQSWTDYRLLRNRCTSALRKAKANYHRNLLEENRLSPRKFWKAIKSIFPIRTKSSAFQLKNRVNDFANYFTNIVTKMKLVAYPLINFAWRYHKKEPLRTKSMFTFSYVSVVFVESELRKLKRNKAAGIDSLPPNLLKDCARTISRPIAHIINLSLRTSLVPSAWKSAKITPIYKSGNSEEVSNYRPISVLPVLSKILERAVHNQLYDYMETNNLLNNAQFGFRKKRSTKLATTLFCDSIRMHIDKGRMVGSLFIDLSKAFDTIGHSILLEKLLRYGILGTELNWFSDYLFNRSQQVEIDGTNSNTNCITSSVPQGSILGPLMFIIFFNDLSDCLQHCDIFQYADDTVILFSAQHVDEIEFAINEDLKRIGSYCQINELLLNLKPGKTEVMLFGTAQRLCRHGKNLKIMYQYTQINFVTEYVYLGNVLDNHLILTKNFDRSYRKASGRLRLLSLVRRNLTSTAAELIYKMTILPLLTYSSTIKTIFNDTQLLKFASIERRASVIVGKPVESIYVNISNQITNLVSKCLNSEFGHDKLDSYFVKQKNERFTRRNGLVLKPPRIKLETARPSFYYGGVELFNRLPLEIRESILK